MFFKSKDLYIPIAYTGYPEPGSPSTIKLPDLSHPIKSTVNTDKFQKIWVNGDLLTLEDGMVVYCSLMDSVSLPGRYVVFDIDNQREIERDPIFYLYSEAKLLRKVIKIVPTSLTDSDFPELLKNFPKDKINVEEIKETYKSAVKFYIENSTYLIMAFTCDKEGKDIKIDFYSPNYFYGVVQYTTDLYKNERRK